MTIISRTGRTPAAAGALVLAALVLSGCSLIPHPGGGSLPGSDGKSGGISIPGVGSIGTGKLPSDWPASVPVIHGDVLFGAAAGNAKTTDGRIWNATIKVSGAGDYGKISSQLKGAGFAVDTEPDPGDAEGGTGTFLKDPDAVLVVVTKADDKTGWVANYTVTESQGSR
ncbi:hypothetical protein GCM10009840_28890 [Pseudolysinimonas kribbensis]|uniref:hypothetical protein n=1 Tax=Pseudolysinimonas kribbensis TaxID=433641 RepID=UPI0031E04042